MKISIFIITILLIIQMLLIMSCNDDIYLNNKGIIEHNNGNYEEAIIYYNKAIAINNDFGEAYINRGGSKLMLEQYEKAINDFDIGLDIMPDHVRGLCNRATAKTSINEVSAIQDIDRALTLDSEYIYAYYCRGNYYYSIGDYISAVEEFKYVIANGWENYNIYISIANAQIRIDDCENAINNINTADEKSPYETRIYWYRSHIYYSCGDYLKALGDLNYVIMMEGGNAAALNDRGLLKLDMEDYIGGIADFKRAIDIAPHDNVYYNNLGYAFYKNGDYINGLEYLNKADDIAKDDDKESKAYIYKNKGLIMAGLGEYNEAIRLFSKAIELKDEFAEAYYNRGLAKEASADDTGAEEDLMKAREIDPSIFEGNG